LLALPFWALIKTPLKNPDVSIAEAGIRSGADRFSAHSTREVSHGYGHG
jgi:hypothetical protein